MSVELNMFTDVLIPSVMLYLQCNFLKTLQWSTQSQWRSSAISRFFRGITEGTAGFLDLPPIYQHVEGIFSRVFQIHVQRVLPRK